MANTKNSGMQVATLPKEEVLTENIQKKSNTQVTTVQDSHEMQDPTQTELEVGKILQEASKEQTSLNDLATMYSQLTVHKVKLTSKVNELNLKLKPKTRFDGKRILEPGQTSLTPDQRIMADVERKNLKNVQRYIDNALSSLKAKMRILAGKRKKQLNRQRLQMDAASTIYLRKNQTNIQKRICKLFNTAFTEESVMQQLTELRVQASKEAEFSSRLLPFIKELDEETYILTSGRTRYQTQIHENIRMMLQSWNGTEEIDFTVLLKKILSTKIPHVL